MADQHFLPIEDYGLIGDMHTCALVSKEGSIDFMCWPKFDSSSIFCRLLDSNRAGYWSVRPMQNDGLMTKQHYLSASNILQTRWIHEDGVVTMNDFFVVHEKEAAPGRLRNRSPILARRLECIRGEMRMEIRVCPSPDYGRQDERATIFHDQAGWRVDFKPSNLRLSIVRTGDAEFTLNDGPDAQCAITFAKVTKSGLPCTSSSHR